MATIISPDEFKKYFKPRDPDSHKGTFGRALCIAGSFGMAGAAILSARAALRSGAGLCEVFLDRAIYEIVASAVPEAVFSPVIEEDGLPMLSKRLNVASSVLIGPGSGATLKTKEYLDFLIENCEKPMVIDADGINVLSKHIDVLEKHKAEIVLTPHPAEMARLMNTTVNKVQENREKTACDFAVKYQVSVVLKGHNTVVALPCGKCFVNPTGNAGMATGGSGDVLAGIIVSLAAQGIPVGDAAKMGVYIHGLAGDMAASTLSQHSLMPSDIVEALPSVFLKFEKQSGV